MNELQEKFHAELVPLLTSIEQAILFRRSARIRRVELAPAELSADIIMLVDKYSKAGLNREQIREVLNSPTATAIARRLGARP